MKTKVQEIKCCSRCKNKKTLDKNFWDIADIEKCCTKALEEADPDDRASIENDFTERINAVLNGAF